MNGAGVDLSDLLLKDLAGSQIRLGDLIDRPTVVNLVRYYGCSPCRAFLTALADRHAEIESSGGAVLGVGPAAAYQAELLVNRGIPFRLLLDPARRLGDAIGLEPQSLARFLFDVRGWWRWLRSWFRGGRQGAITAGTSTLPAVLVLDAGARVVWAHRGRFLGDYPPMSRVLGRLSNALEEGSRR